METLAAFNKMFILTIIATLCATKVIAQDCMRVNFGEESIVCQCNATYCDFYPDPKSPEKGEFIWYVSSKGGKRMNKANGKMSDVPNHSKIIKINPSETFQSMEGFGAAFTDAAGINIKSLSQEAQDNLMRSYFSEDGSKYNFGRVPIGGSDFSLRGYTYDDTHGDVELKNFSIANEDFEYKIPLMKKAMELNPSIRFLSASWTAPPWMKNRDAYYGYSYLLDKYYQVYANYIVKFLEEYKKLGFEMWAVSTGNEPFTSLLPIKRINSMFWSPKTASKWVKENLGPTLEKSTSNNTYILMIDDQRFTLPWYVIDVKLYHKEALKYVKGLAIHWYADIYIPAQVLDLTHDIVPDKFILITESSLGDRPWDFRKVILGSWGRAQTLFEKLIENFNHWVVGWVDWNLALNTKGGPTWVDNYIDAPIIIDAEKDTFYKQPMYYAMMHFSKFVPRESVKIEATSSDSSILVTAFKTKDNNIVTVLYNSSGQKRSVSLVIKQVGSIDLDLEEYSMHTVLNKNE